MYLKSIEVQGFKSFANKILFEFHNGITCIVGPNGSGKSNVADAVRWVLGEQSAKQLRGGSMQDVIFSGTEQRKPLGYAYVAITLDNSDHALNTSYDEVTVSRRVFRSGESEYKINQNAVRLRDVQELFYDTGIGKEGYSIIGQGQIDRIISNKPEERRELFDEAVGIVKFKRRKAQTLKKLESEHENLVRVKDILSELERQVGPLERQAENAKKYLLLREELKTLDCALFTLDSAGTRKQLADLSERNAILCGDLEETDQALKTLKEQYAEVNETMEKLSSDLAGAQNRYQEQTYRSENLSGRIAALDTETFSAEKEKEHVTGRLLQIEKEQETAESDLKKEQEKGKQEEQEEADCDSRLKAAEENLLTLQAELDKNNEALARTKEDILGFMGEKTGIFARLQHFDTLKEQVQIKKGELSSRVIQLKSEQQNENESLVEYERRLGESRSTAVQVKKELAEIAGKKNELEKERDAFQKKAQDAQRESRIAASKAESLSNLAERYEGFNSSIQKIMEYRKQSPKLTAAVFGVVSDLITVEKEYETAIEIALGGAISNVVTDNQETAKQLIAYLKEHRFGRATFLPLTAIKKSSASFPAGVLKEPGMIGLADTLVKRDPKFDAVCESLLGRTFVVDHIDHAIAISKAYHQTLRLVTLSGELLNPGGAMTGGAFRSQSNLLGRKREIAELTEEVEKQKKAFEEAEKGFRRCSEEFARQKQRGDKLSEKLSTLAIEETAMQLKAETAKERLEVIAVNLGDLASQIRQMEGQLSEILADRKKVEEEAESLESQTTNRQADADMESRAVDEKNEKKEKLLADISALKASQAAASERKSFIARETERLTRQLLALSEEKDELTGKQTEIDASIATNKASLVTLREELSECAKLREKASGELSETRNRQQELSRTQQTFFDRQQELSDKKAALEKDAIRLGTQMERLDEHMEQITEYLQTEYELLPSEAVLPEEEITATLPEYKRQVSRKKEEIRALGHVNVNAIEEFKETSGRYIFMKEQVEDLTRSEEELVKIIKELDEGMRKQFNEQFSLIQTEFDRVFQELFGGGHGRLEIVEDEDVIEAGIRIISQPPGKKLSNMMQLSGGEKALTAIALLFAIQNLKPSPFCLLDEIEAALDDSNVSRFAGYLHKLTARTQFILISHRRGTMVMADRLYGITMQEKGVSALVSVNLIENELDS